MKKIATTCVVLGFSLLLGTSPAQAQVQKPAAEFSAVWDTQLNRWKDTAQTFQMSYAPSYSLVQRTGKFRTTYSGFVPTPTTVYQSRFFWEPGMTYSSALIDSVHDDGVTVTPIRLDSYDRKAGRTTFTRSTWNGTSWVPMLTSVSMTDELGIQYSFVNHAMLAGTLTLTDSTHVTVTKDFKGNVTAMKVSRWTLEEPTLKTLSEQRYTLNGDGSIASAEVWTSPNGSELTRSMRLHSFDWAIRDKSFPYVTRDEGMDLFYGGDGWRSAKVDIWNGTDWSEMYSLEQTFDDENRLTSYTFNGMTRDTFVFDQGLLTLAQSDIFMSNTWVTNRGNRTAYDRDANGTLRSVMTQRFDAGSSQYVNERLYFYQSGTASVAAGSESISIALYPNPVVGELKIRTGTALISAEVLGLTGETLISSRDESIDVSSLSPGAYGIRVKTDGGEKTLKFIKVH
ncbi:MAG TPA: T9SS type A sorting domain-containing protein [Candidatus Kapabacteria bacterium]|nr:T9SS type A sorting domain-containing protein [Candidatus Kapabacteria bacterium]